MLANIALTGMEEYLNNAIEDVSVVRYADDFVVVLEREEDLEKAYELIREFCGRAGLEIHPEKTKTKHTVKEMKEGEGIGTEFLGFWLRQDPHKGEPT